MNLLKTTLIIVCISFVSGGTATAKESPRSFGAGVAATDTVLVSTLMASPDAYVGQTIRVKGVAVAVCAHRGCWLNLASDTEGETLRVKVPDGAMVFPPDLVGDVVLAEGIWTANKLDLETTKELCATNAKRDGKDFDPASVTACLTLYQLSGTGAVVVGP